MTKPGKFITFEGIEGAGKTTGLEYVADYLAQYNISVLQTREPGGTQLGEAVRRILLDAAQDKMVPDAELLLIFAARAQHIRQVIRPALAAGQWVLCDRFTDASYAYQGAGRSLDKTRIARLAAWVQQGLMPDLTLLLDIPAELGLTRARQRSAPDRFESETVHFFNRVRAEYLRLATHERERITQIDATQSLSQVQHHLRQALQRLLPHVD